MSIRSKPEKAMLFSRLNRPLSLLMNAIRLAAMHVANTFLANLQRVHPLICGLCGEPHAGRAFCHWCTQSLPGLRIERCDRCAAPIRPGRDTLCQTCCQRQWAFDRTVTLADYAMPLDRLILKAKHHRQPQLITNAAHSLAQIARPRLPWPAWPELVMPVPLSKARLRERGFNQSVLLARVLAREWQIKLSLGALVRVRNTRPQQMLARRDRHRNLEAAFECRASLEGKRLLLVDDVITSGATLHWAAVALRDAGAASVTVATIARTR